MTDTTIDYSRAYSFECLIRLIDARERAHRAEIAFVIKGDNERADRMKNLKIKIDGLVAEIEEIANIM